MTAKLPWLAKIANRESKQAADRPLGLRHGWDLFRKSMSMIRQAADFQEKRAVYSLQKGV
jgi:hypothetical protein